MIYYGIELADGTIIQNLTCDSGPSLPTTNLIKGRIFYHSTQQTLYVCNGVEWKSLGGSTGGVITFNGRGGAVTLLASDLVGLIGPTNLPKATNTTLGAVRVGSGISVTDGTISVSSSTEIPSGSRLLWAQPAAPTGWTQLTSTEAANRFLRVVNTVGGSVGSGGSGGYGYGGIDDPTVMNKVPSHTHTFSGSGSATVGAHTHNIIVQTIEEFSLVGIHNLTNSRYYIPGVKTPGSTISAFTSVFTTKTIPTESNSTSAAVTTSGTTTANTGAANWQPKYLNLILCSKN